MDRETVVSRLFGSVSKGKRDRDQNVVQTLRDRQNLRTILEWKAEYTVPGEKLAQVKLYEAEADVEVKHWENRNSDIALYEINQEFEYNSRINGLIRLKETKLASMENWK